MAEYIDRDAAIAAAFSASAIGNSAYRDVYDTVNRIRLIPAADVVERGVGKWLTVKEEADGPLKEFLETLPHYRCSACDYKFIAMGKGEKPHKYCPNCGTRMVSDG